MNTLKEIRTTGLHVQYYIICPRKLWLYDHGIELEHTNDQVLQGKNLHEKSYQCISNKEVLINNMIRIDLYGDYVGEVKSSSKMQEADFMQLKYYLYILKEMGIEKKGKIHYPKEKRVKEVELTNNDVNQLQDILKDIEFITTALVPPRAKKLPYCRKCAYFTFCWVSEE